MSKPKILISRAIFPEVVARLAQHFDVASNQADELWTPAQLIEQLQGKQGVFTTGGERIDAALLAACPELKICANMAVGYNNFDLDAMTTAGVLATNAPDVLTETTADFGFALLMATARRMAEAEHFLRAGQWTRWRYDMFAGSDIQYDNVDGAGADRRHPDARTDRRARYRDGVVRRGRTAGAVVTAGPPSRGHAGGGQHARPRGRLVDAAAGPNGIAPHR